MSFAQLKTCLSKAYEDATGNASDWVCSPCSLGCGVYTRMSFVSVVPQTDVMTHFVYSGTDPNIITTPLYIQDYRVVWSILCEGKMTDGTDAIDTLERFRLTTVTPGFIQTLRSCNTGIERVTSTLNLNPIAAPKTDCVSRAALDIFLTHREVLKGCAVTMAKKLKLTSEFADVSGEVFPSSLQLTNEVVPS